MEIFIFRLFELGCKRNKFLQGHCHQGTLKWKKASENKKSAHRLSAMDDEEQDSLKHLKPLSKVEEQSKKDIHQLRQFQNVLHAEIELYSINVLANWSTIVPKNASPRIGRPIKQSIRRPWKKSMLNSLAHN